MRRYLETFTRYLPLWTVLCGVLAYQRPDILAPLKPHIDWLFMFTMLGVGAVLNYEDFIPILKRPQSALLGTLTQFLVMPLAAFIIAKALRLSPTLTLGLILVGSVPGAMASNVISYLAKADVAYSISVTTTSTFLAPLLTPAFTYFFARTIISIPVLPMFFSIVKMVIIPLLIGFFIRRYFSRAIDKVSFIFPAFSTVFIALICGLVIALNKTKLSNISLMVFLAVFLLNAIGLYAGYKLGKIYGFDKKRRRTLSIEVGMQNAGLGAVLALKHFHPAVAIVPVLFATWCVITASILAEIWSKRRKQALLVSKFGA
ncbi:MAG: bile acid:sodium symporter family protein [Candidatus Omnitrophota bacterium]